MAARIVPQQENPMGRRLELRLDWKKETQIGLDLGEQIASQKVPLNAA